MMGSGKTCIYPKSFIEGTHASCSKLGCLITYDFMGDLMQGKYIVEVNRGDSISQYLVMAFVTVYLHKFGYFYLREGQNLIYSSGIIPCD